MGQLELFEVLHFVHGTVYQYKNRGCRCDECRQAATAYRRLNAKNKCSRCGAPTGSKRVDAVCHACRKVQREHRPGTQVWFVCEFCEQRFYRPRKYYGPSANRFCSCRCAGLAKCKAPEDLADPWRARMRKSDGLTEGQMRKLVAKWKRQGRSCFYCDGSVQTADHVIPLTLGGTSYEGNLVPCCKSCNGSKCNRLLIEWRLRRGAIKSAA